MMIESCDMTIESCDTAIASCDKVVCHYITYMLLSVSITIKKEGTCDISIMVDNTRTHHALLIITHCYKMLYTQHKDYYSRINRNLEQHYSS